MIRLEHLNLVVVNLEKSKAFYFAAFPHWKVRAQGEGDWYGKSRQWIHIGDDYNYITLNGNGESLNRDVTGHQIGLAHFCFEVSNLEALKERLSEAGFPIKNDGTPNKSRQNVYYFDPDGFEVEFVQYFSDSPIERNNCND